MCAFFQPRFDPLVQVKTRASPSDSNTGAAVCVRRATPAARRTLPVCIVLPTELTWRQFAYESVPARSSFDRSAECAGGDWSLGSFTGEQGPAQRGLLLLVHFGTKCAQGESGACCTCLQQIVLLQRAELQIEPMVFLVLVDLASEHAAVNAVCAACNDIFEKGANKSTFIRNVG